MHIVGAWAIPVWIITEVESWAASAYLHPFLVISNPFNEWWWITSKSQWKLNFFFWSLKKLKTSSFNLDRVDNQQQSFDNVSCYNGDEKDESKSRSVRQLVQKKTASGKGKDIEYFCIILEEIHDV